MGVAARALMWVLFQGRAAWFLALSGTDREGGCGFLVGLPRIDTPGRGEVSRRPGWRGRGGEDGGSRASLSFVVYEEGRKVSVVTRRLKEYAGTLLPPPETALRILEIASKT